MQVFLGVTPEHEAEATRYTRALAHVAYRIGPDSTLLRRNLLLQSRGGLLCVSDTQAALIRDPGVLCSAVIRECNRRGYSGIVLDFELPPTKDRRDFVRLLGSELKQHRLYLPPSYADDAPNAIMLLGSAVSGGNFQQYLQEAADKCGPSHLALDVERLRMDFHLPSASGEGRPLTTAEFQQRMEKGPSTFFSPELCARYFTYTQNKQPHFVLFDDADTLNRKLRIASSMGFAAALFMWPEIDDLAGKLRWR